MISITHKENCCGCTACASVCSHKAIRMEPDGLGFLYPVVDSALCTDCGLCEKVCAFHPSYDKSLNLSHPDIYAVRHRNAEEVATSRSGAMFIALSDYVLANRGIVYGAAFADHFRVVHKRASDVSGRNEFKGSKYVQSDLHGIFGQVAADLREGRTVLFSGTPCQTAGLRSFLRNRRISMELLYLCDVVCHGVPAPYIWRDYIAYLEQKAGQKIVKADFRDKSRLGWGAHKESFCYADGTYQIGDIYTHIFYKHIILRSSCGKCPYTNFTRPSDITIGDFWGSERLDSELNKDDKGLSLVLVNTQKGREWLDLVETEINRFPAVREQCLQPNLQHPSQLHPHTERFTQEYREKGFLYVMKKYGNIGWRYRMERFYRDGKDYLKKGAKFILMRKR